MRLRYWVAKRIDASDAYSIRGQTKTFVLKIVWEREKEGEQYEKPKRVVTPDFTGAFDLMCQCLGEGGPWWEN